MPSFANKNTFALINKKNPLIMIVFLFVFFSIFAPLPLLGSEKKFFSSKELQAILKNPFYLYDEEKNQELPIEIEKFSFQKTILIKEKGYFSEIENTAYCPEKIGTLSLCEIYSSFSENTNAKKVGKIYLQKNDLLKHLYTISNQNYIPPIEGKLEVDSGGKIRILSLSKNGKQLNVEKTFENIKNSLIENPFEKYIQMEIEILEPKTKTQSAQEMGIVEKIGQGESNFSGSPKNRIHNIKTAVSKFHGLILDKDEEFSFVKYLGAVDGENGYLPELVIKNNETIPEFGGGICQVSTTFFRSALNAGFKITERKNHAYPVQYYAPQGTDATIYIPHPDFKFINNSPKKILIQAKIEGTKLFIDFYGTDDGRKIEIDGPRITERNEKKQMKTTLFQKVFDATGNEIINDEFKSFYDNPDKYHTQSKPLSERPDGWSKSEWEKYKKENGL